MPGGRSGWWSWPPCSPQRPGASRPEACRNRARVTGAYRCLDHEAVDPQAILARAHVVGHQETAGHGPAGAGGTGYHRGGLARPSRHPRPGPARGSHASGPARPYDAGADAGAPALGPAGAAGVGPRPRRRREAYHPQAPAACRHRTPAVAEPVWRRCARRPPAVRRPALCASVTAKPTCMTCACRTAPRGWTGWCGRRGTGGLTIRSAPCGPRSPPHRWSRP